MTSLYFGYVTGSTDEYNSGRIKAVIAPDKGKAINNIPYAFPLMPKMMHVQPKVGEGVLVFIDNDKGSSAQRYYVGPVISQPNKMAFEDYFALTPSMFLNGGVARPDVATDNVPPAIGAMPKEEDVALMGRKNTDVILSDDIVRIRAGVRDIDSNGRVVFNKETPSFIKLKVHETPLKTLYNADGSTTHTETKSTAAVVADKVLLLSPNGDGAPAFNDRTESISDEQMKELIEKAHELPYGDVLCDFLALFVKMFINHMHPYPGMPPFLTDTDSLAFFAKYSSDKADIENKLLSKDVAIN